MNAHLHVIAMDGAYAEQPDRTLLFHPLPAPSDEDIASLARAVRAKAKGRCYRLGARPGSVILQMHDEMSAMS